MNIVRYADTSADAIQLNRLIQDCFFCLTDDDITDTMDVDSTVTVDVTVFGNICTIKVDIIFIDPITATAYNKMYIFNDVPVNTVTTIRAVDGTMTVNTLNIHNGEYTAVLNRCCCMLDAVCEADIDIALDVQEPLIAKIVDDTVLITADPSSIFMATKETTGIMSINGKTAVNGNIDINGVGDLTVIVNADKGEK